MKATKREASTTGAAGAIVLRAGHEPEGDVEPGERRALKVISESAVHLSSTAQELTHGLLCEDVKQIVAKLEVPVRVDLVKARWAWDFDNEERERVVASLGEGHRFADIKMILGVDYLGKWATIHMTVAMEPPPAPEPPASSKGRSYKPAIYLLIVSVLLTLLGASGMVGPELMAAGVLGVMLSAGVAYVTQKMNASAAAEANRTWQEDQALKADIRQIQRDARTFKLDDLRLFRSAMEEVFKQVVDGIQQRGGEIVQRIEGDQTVASEPQVAAKATAAVAEI